MTKHTAIKLDVEVAADHTIRVPDDVQIGPAEVTILSRVDASERPTIAAPVFRTELARELWEQRQKIATEVRESLNGAGVEAEVAARRGGHQASK
jgi:hypothetical protein